MQNIIEKNEKYIFTSCFRLLPFFIFELWFFSRRKKTVSTPVNQVTSLPSISFEEMKEIHEQCDFIDFIFYKFDFSMSVNARTNVQKIVGFVTPNIPALNPECQPTGRIFFQKNGELMIEADMYFDDVCQYFVFYKDGKQVYANDMAPQGKAYFKQVFSRVQVEATKLNFTNPAKG